MPSGSLSLAQYPAAMVRLKCLKCSKSGQYRTTVLIELLLAAVTSIALTGATQAEIGLNLQTYEQCAGLLRAIAGRGEWAKSADWYETASEAFVLAAAEERIRIRGDGPGSWLQIELETRAVEESLNENYNATEQPMINNSELLDFCVDIGEAIVP